jgi:hypothetical protein
MPDSPWSNGLLRDQRCRSAQSEVDSPPDIGGYGRKWRRRSAATEGPIRRFERLARHQSQAGLRRPSPSWLELEETSGISSQKGWSNFTFCFHDREEIGPAALSKIGKDTGLRPEDL